MKLVLGVLDVSYTDPSSTKVTTTGDVAEILESNYHVMGTFFESRKDKIAQWLADDMANSIQALVNSGRTINAGSRGSSASQFVAGRKRTMRGEQSGTLTYGADQKIEAAFRVFIFSNEMQTKLFASAIMQAQIISAAAAAGRSARFKSGYTPKRRPRAAFVDTGLYVSAFRAWSEE